MYACSTSRTIPRPLILATSIAAALLAALPASASTLTWDISPGTVGVGNGTITGGNGTWDTTLGNWTLDAGANNVAWNNANNDQAIFGDVAGTVTLGSGITANALTFNTTGYTVTGNTITLAGTTPTINVNSASTATIASVLTGTSGLTVAGNGNLILTGISTYTGDTIVSSGTLTLGAGVSPMGRIRGAVTINPGATMKVTAADALGYTAGQQVATININGGTFTNGVNGNNGFRTNFVLTGGTINESVAQTGTSGINFQASEGFGITTLASSTTSVVSARTVVRAGNLTFNVASGTTANGIDLSVTGVIAANGGTGIVKTGAGTMSIGAQSTIGGTTTVNNGVLVLSAGGGATGVIRGTATVNTGATLRLSTGDATGYTTGVTVLNLNGGTLDVAVTNNQTLNTAVNMTAGTISGIGNIDLFTNNTSINTFAAATPSVIGGPTIGLRQNDTQFNIADGAAASDLIVNSILTSGSSTTTGNHNLVKNGPGTLLLNAANTYSGTTKIANGKLALGNTASLASSNIIAGNGGVFDVTQLPGSTFSVSTGRTLTGGGTPNVGGDVLGNLSADGGTINIAGTSTAGTFTLGGNLTLNSGTMVFDLANVNTVGGGVNDLAKVANLTLTGVNNITINKLSGVLASSTYTLLNYTGTLTGDVTNLLLSGAAGGTTRQAFALDTTTTPGSLLLNVTGNSANLVWVGGSAANAWDINTTVNWSGATDGNNRYFDGDTVLIDDTGNNASPITLNTPVLPGALTVNNTAKDYAIEGVGSIGGALGLTKNGTGKLTLSTANTFTGPVAINAGTVSVSTLANAGIASGLGAGTTLSLGDATHAATLQYTGGTTSTDRAITVNAGGATLEVADPAATLTTTGAISGTGSLTKTGNGALTVGAPISTTGDINFNGGNITVNAAINNSTGIKLNAGSLRINTAGNYGGATINNGTTLTVATTGGATGLGSGDTFVNAGGTLVGTAGDSFGYTIGASPATIHINGGTVTDVGTGSYRITLPNLDFTGGTLTSAVGNNGDANGTYSFLGRNGAASVTTNAATSTALINALSVGLQTSTTFNVAAGNVTGGATPGVDLMVSANLLQYNAGSTVTKAGAGVMVMAGNNTYAGATTVNEGTLRVNGSLTGSVITVNAATLGGNGTVGTLNIAAGGTLAPGDGVGTLTTGALSLNSASFVKFELATPGIVGGGINDLLSVGGALTLDGTLQVAALGGFGDGTYRLFNYTGVLTNNVLDLDAGFLALHPGSFIDVGTANQVSLVVIPEPSTAIALLGGVACLLGLRRKPRR